MSREFKIVHEGEVPGAPEQAWEAMTTGIGGWLWPMEIEGREGGSAAEVGVVTVWDPPHRLVTRMDGEDGWFNQLETVIESRPGGRAWLRYVHSGVFLEDWDNQYDGASKHTVFYMATMRQYIQHFSGKPVTYASGDGPEAAKAPDALGALLAKLGLGVSDGEGTAVRIAVPGLGTQEGVVDYRDDNFIGVRTSEALIRFFGRNAFGAAVGFAVHDFGGKVEQSKLQDAWQAWIDSVYA